MSSKRSCTDIFWYIIFILITFGSIGGLIWYSIGFRGASLRLIKGFDSYGNVCDQQNVEWQREVNNYLDANGTADELSSNTISTIRANVGTDTTGKSFIFYLDVLHSFQYAALSKEICVRECVSETISSVNQYKAYVRKTNNSLCFPSAPSLDKLGSEHFDMNGPCPILPIEPTIALSRWCLPKDLVKIFNSSEALQAEIIAAASKSSGADGAKVLPSLNGYTAQVVRDMSRVWPVLAVVLLIAVVLSFLMTLVTQCIAGFAVILLTVAGVLGTGALSAFLWYKFHLIRIATLPETRVGRVPFLQIEFDAYWAYLGLGIIATVGFVVVLSMSIVMWTRLKQVWRVFGESSRFVRHVPFLFAFPIVELLIIIVWFALWSVVFVALLSTTAFTFNTYAVVEYDLTKTDVAWMIAAGFVAGWGLVFVCDIQEMVVAVSVNDWFEQILMARSTSLANCICCSAFFVTLFYHGGSLAFASLLVWTTKAFRWLLMYIDRKVKAATEADGTDDGAMTQCVASCCAFVGKCCCVCLKCVECCLEYIDTRCYFFVVQNGYSYCSAMREYLASVAVAPLDTAALSMASHFTLMLGKLGVAVATTLISQVFFLRTEESDAISDEVQYQYTFTWLPSVVVFVLAYLVARPFFQIFDAVLDCVFVVVVLRRYQDAPKTQQSLLRSTDEADQAEAVYESTVPGAQLRSFLMTQGQSQNKRSAAHSNFDATGHMATQL